MRAGGDAGADLESVVGGVHVELVWRLACDLAVPRQRSRHTGGAAADGEALHADAIDAQIERLRMPHADDVVVDLPPQPHAQRVVAGDGEEVPHGDAAARAERLIVTEAHVLLQQLRHLVAGGGRRVGQRAIAHRQAADLPRRREVALEVRGREGQAGGDVVEAVVGFVGQQQRGRVDVQRQHVAHRVRVLGAIQTMRAHVRHLRMRLRRAIERRRDRCDDVARLGGVGTRSTRGRHLSAANLVEHLLPQLRVAGDIGGRARERESRGAGAVVVAGHAVLLDERARGGVDGRGGGVRGDGRASRPGRRPGGGGRDGLPRLETRTGGNRCHPDSKNCRLPHGKIVAGPGGAGRRPMSGGDL